MYTKDIATFLNNRVSDLRDCLKAAFDGLGNGCSINTAKIQAALWGIDSSINAIADISLLLQHLPPPTPDNPPDTSPDTSHSQNDEKSED